MTTSEFNFLAEAEERLDKTIVAYAQENNIGISRSQIKISIEEGSVFVNGTVITKAGYALSTGDEVEFSVVTQNNYEIIPYEFKLEILFEDPHLIVINKPAGLTVHPGAGNSDKTLVNALHFHFLSSRQDLALFKTNTVRPGIVHRLDKDTSGVMVVAKDVETHAALSDQFRDRTIDRIYTALVLSSPRRTRGVDRSESGVIEGAIGRDPVNRMKMRVVEDGGREAKTFWNVIERMEYAALLEVKLATGRTHQIRVHLNHVMSPVLGDKLYGDFTSLPKLVFQSTLDFGRQALHASVLDFSHPITNERLSFKTEVPEDFKLLIQKFR